MRTISISFAIACFASFVFGDAQLPSTRATASVAAIIPAYADSPYIGYWALTLPTGAPGWLGITQEQDELKAGILWGGGSVKPVDSIKVEGGKLVITRVQVQRNGPDKGKKITETITATQANGNLKLVTVKTKPDGSEFGRAEFTGKRIPPLPPKPDLSKAEYGKPIALFNGKNLDGWVLTNPNNANGWVAENGMLVNKPVQTEGKKHVAYGNLKTSAEFEDFNLKLEVNVPEKSNSGIYLRGIYELQILDSYGKPLSPHNMGAIFSRITPAISAEKPAGQWQTLDVTLMDRHVTVVLNGKPIIDNEPLLGCTGGALGSDPMKPGPLYLQGNHGAASFRNIVLTPILPEKELNPNTIWLRDAKWGVFAHYLAHTASTGVPSEMNRAVWNQRVNSFQVKKLGEQLSALDVPYFFITIGQKGGYFCAPNKTHEKYFGSDNSNSSDRDLVADLAAELIPRGIKLCVYLPAHGKKESLDVQKQWQEIITEWSNRWGNSISAWWIDGGAFQQPEMYQAYTDAFKSGNPDALVSYNTGPIGWSPEPKKPATLHEDYLAGEVNWRLPVSGVRPWDQKEYYMGPNLLGDQLHFLTFLGTFWGMGEPRFPDELVVGWTKHTNNHGGTISWDVPLSYSGVIPASHYRQLQVLKEATR